MRTLFLSFAVAACSFAAQAQNKAATTSKAEHQAAVAHAGDHGHDCLGKADANTWRTLGLTADQTKRLDELKAAVSTDKKAASTVPDQLKAILSPEQLTKYNEWCKGLASKPASTERTPTPQP